jgi:DivIVA domain-containing protein
MEQDDAEKRIAELERQLADAVAPVNASPQQRSTTGSSLTPEQVRNTVFSKPPIGKRGYNEDEVDAFLDLVEAELRDPTRRALSPEQVRNIAFSKPPMGKRGYNENEVDAFLDLVEEQLKARQAGAFLPQPQAAPSALNEKSAAPRPSRRWELFPVPSIWKRRPPLAIDADKDAIRVVNTKTNSLMTSASLAQVTATRAQSTSLESTNHILTGRNPQPLLVLSIPGLRPLVIASTAMNRWDSGGLQYRFSWRGRVQEAGPTYALADTEWFSLVEKFGLTPHLDGKI